MRRLVWALVIFAVIWSGWWAFAAFSTRNGIEAWLLDRRAEGWQADVTSIDVSGYPRRINIVLTEPAFADPETGVAFETEALRLNAPTIWPGHLTVTLPSEAFRIASPWTQRTVTQNSGQANLRLRPGTALELERAAITSGPWEVASPQGTIWQAGGLVLRLQQTTGAPQNYTVEINAPAFTLGGVTRRALRIPQDWPVSFDALKVLGDISFDRPIDRRALEEKRPQPREINLEIAEAVWGTLSLRASAQLRVSDTGLLNGDLDLQARNWQEILNLMETTRILPQSFRPQVENILDALARGSGNPDSIEMTLEFDDGRMFLGFIPLGDVPPIVLR